MKRLMRFIVGALVGFMLAATALVGLGLLLNALDLILYASETEQQRNFNIALAACIAASAAGGWWLSRKP